MVLTLARSSELTGTLDNLPASWPRAFTTSRTLSEAQDAPMTKIPGSSGV